MKKILALVLLSLLGSTVYAEHNVMQVDKAKFQRVVNWRLEYHQVVGYRYEIKNMTGAALSFALEVSRQTFVEPTKLVDSDAVNLHCNGQTVRVKPGTGLTVCHTRGDISFDVLPDPAEQSYSGKSSGNFTLEVN
ncbi:MAG: hypothetical protein ACYCQI_15515 [Gammaproteobacteria bacterium]